MRTYLWVAIAGAVGISLFVAPDVAAVALGAHLVSMTAIMALRLHAALRARRVGRRARGRAWSVPFVSIHVPICNEPPEIVDQTLRALARLSWDRFEVIVLDNNTRDPALYLPIEALCRALGPRFRFRHVDRLEGAKAGALALTREMTDPRAELVLVVDADYEVRPSLVSRAVRYLEPGVSFVQFPQAYRNGDGETGLGGDYGRYFDAVMPWADHTGAALLTGTLCFIRVEALDAAGGWCSSTVTEDAELGVRLCIRGFRGRFAPEIGGRGLMPTELSALRKQRRRWAFGNAQTLRQILRPGSLRTLGLRRAAGVLVQLTAWFDFLLLPLLVIVLGALLGSSGPMGGALGIAGATVLLYLALSLAVHAAAPPLVEPRCGFCKSFVARAGMLWEGTTAWLEGLAGCPLAFQRTDKFARLGRLTAALPQLVSSGALLLAAVLLSVQGAWLPAAAAMVASLAFGSVLHLHFELQKLLRAPPPKSRITLPRATRASVPAMENA